MDVVRCAVCRSQIRGHLNDAQTKIASTWGGEFLGVKLGDHWLCNTHRDRKPLPVEVGTVLVLFDTAKTLRLGMVTEVPPNGGFYIGATSYSPFGMRLRGYGEAQVIRIATPADIERRKAMDETEAQARAKKETHDAQVKADCRCVAQAVKDILPDSMEETWVDATLLEDGLYEITFRVTPEELGITL